jgi:N-acylglucosamine-6-phosphate 2-epimerase
VDTTALFAALRGGLVVSCQPEVDDRENDPMNRAEIMAALAAAAWRGGAAGIRADGPAHITAIRAAVPLPIIGIYKYDLPGFAVRITPTLALAQQLAAAGADMIALDATLRPRPEGDTPGGFIRRVSAETGLPVLADVSTYEEGLAAAEAGAAAVATTLSGYTPYSPQLAGPDFELIERLAGALRIPVIAEGRIAAPEQAAQALQCGAWAVTVGSAITRPRTITAGFVKGMG